MLKNNENSYSVYTYNAYYILNIIPSLYKLPDSINTT